ncbi:hypothetical protein [Streptomyces tendae]|nr:hypothetical protein [Streptomyces tendae]
MTKGSPGGAPGTKRVATVSAPYGPLALTGTHGAEDHPGGQLPDIPGR